MLLPDFWANLGDFRSTLQITLGHRVITKFNCNLSHRVEAPPPPRTQKAVKWVRAGGGGERGRVDNCMLFVSNSQRSQLSAYGFCTTSIQMLTQPSPGSPGRPLGCCPLQPPVQPVSVENLWDLLSGARWSVWAPPLSEGQDPIIENGAPGKTNVNGDREWGLSAREH